jgi:histidinol-phosphate aminotransferase
MSRFWNPQVHELTPYVPGEQPRGGPLIKLNTNELPYGPSAAVLEALRGAADERLRLYPDPDSSVLRGVFAERLGLAADQVFLGNGSDEVLAHTFRALFQSNAPVLFPDISYSFYPVYSHFFGLAFETPALGDDYVLDLADYRRPNGGIIFPNPNAPTGIYIPLAQIEALLRDNRDSVVVVDEAYIDFGGDSAVGLIGDYPNLLVVQTLSKSRALAGLRVGAAFGDAGLIEGLMRVKNSFNSYPLDTLAQAGATAALLDEDWFQRCRDRIIASREQLTGALEDMGFSVLPSRANFIFARHESRAAADLYKALREQGILVRYFDMPRIDNFLRISIGSEDECAALVAALAGILAGR